MNEIGVKMQICLNFDAVIAIFEHNLHKFHRNFMKFQIFDYYHLLTLLLYQILAILAQFSSQV